jgi:hypothetical protein
MAVSRKARIGLIAFVLLASWPDGAFDLKLKFKTMKLGERNRAIWQAPEYN